MKTTSGSESVWMQTCKMPTFSPLGEDLEVDVCIVGGGIAGLSAAYLLQREGKSVCVLDASSLATGQTGHTTAHFSNALSDRYFEIEKNHGLEGSKLVYESHTAAIKKVASIVKTEKLECDLVHLDGYLFAKGDDDPKILQRELTALRRAGFNDVEMIEKAPLRFDSGPCIRFPHQMQLHPLKYLSGLAGAIVRDGGHIFTNTRVVSVDAVDSKCAVVKTEAGFKVTCESALVATNSPINDIFAIHTKQAPYRTYALGFALAKGAVQSGLYWDTLDPYHYIRTQQLSEKEDLLIVGGEDHKTGQEEDPAARYDRLEKWTRERFSVVKEVRYRWSGQVMQAYDGLAYLGHNPLDRENIYVITGDSGNGMTHATIGAILICDQIMHRQNPWEKLYSPSRITLRSSSTFLKENLNVALQYGDWLEFASAKTVDALEVGEGAVYRDGIFPKAAYKNANGEITRMSAICPHLGGIVSWNSAEKSWDCPCHGSRFDCKGKVIEGPAFTDLTQEK